MDSAATNENLPPQLIDLLRRYGTNNRGSFPDAFFSLTKNAYNPTSRPYTTADYFRMCPKDYFETGGHPLPSYQFFVIPTANDKYWVQKAGTATDTTAKEFAPLPGLGYWEPGPDDKYGFTEFSYGDQVFDEKTLNCRIKPIAGVPSGTPFWESPPEALPNWGKFGSNITNFMLNCSGESAIIWPSVVMHLGGYNNKPTAGNVAPQLMVNQDGTRTANNVFERSGAQDATAEIPTSKLPACGPTNLGPRSKGFVDAIELLLGADSPSKLARTGKADDAHKLSTVASSLAALYGITQPLYETQVYSVAYATLGCTDCAMHNHAGAGALFPEMQVQGSRPRYADLVGTRDGETATGSCGQINDISLAQNAPVAEGGKVMGAPLNAERICAVFSGTPCGNPDRGPKMTPEIRNRSPEGRPQVWGTFKETDDQGEGLFGINGQNFGNFVIVL